MLAASLQSSLNALLALDPDSAARLDRLNGRVLMLELKGVGINLFFTARQQHFEVGLDNPHATDEDADHARNPDTTISGTPAALFSMAAEEAGPGSGSRGWSGTGSRVTILGDATLARDFERLFSRLDPDIEGLLSGFIGDVAGHQVVSGIRHGARQFRETISEAGVVAGEVFREGLRGGRSGPLIGEKEARNFSDGVDGLRDAVDRLEAKIRVVTESRDNIRKNFEKGGSDAS